VNVVLIRVKRTLSILVEREYENKADIGICDVNSTKVKEMNLLL